MWNSNFNYLKERPNTLIHNSPFPWSIYISNNHNYSICGLSALGDFMWWDNMVDITHILNPPFLPISTEMKNSFRSGYTYQIDEKAVCLYSLLTLTCNLAGCYFAPVNLVDKEKWKALQIAKIEHNIKQLYE